MTTEQGLLLSFSMYFIGAGVGVFSASMARQLIPRWGGVAFLGVCIAIAFWLSRGVGFPFIYGALS